MLAAQADTILAVTTMATEVNRNMLGGSKMTEINQCCLCNELTQNHAHTDILYGPYIFMHGCVNAGKIKFVGSHGGHERSHSTHICMTGHKGAQVNTVT